MSVNAELQKSEAPDKGVSPDGIYPDDNVLIERIVNRDHDAFAILVQRHSNRFYALAWRITSSDQDAEDVVQDAFLKFWNRPELFDPDKNTKFTTWFYRIVSNMAIDYIRKRKKTVGTDNFDWIESDEAGQMTDLKEKQQQAYLEEAIQELPDNQKLALNLCFYEGLSNKEAAEIVGVSVKALESLIMRAKSKIKDYLIRQDVLEEAAG